MFKIDAECEILMNVGPSHCRVLVQLILIYLKEKSRLSPAQYSLNSAESWPETPFISRRNRYW